MRLLPAMFLLVLALGLAVSEQFALFLSGYRPFKTPSVALLDVGQEVDDRVAPRFLAERNRVEVIVPRSMTVGELLELYQIDFPHIRRQIAEQEGMDSVSGDHRLEEGATFVVELTPVQEGVP